MNRFDPQLKMFYHADRMTDWLVGKRPRPILVEIDPTSRCNANCPWCFYTGRQQWIIHTKGTNADIDTGVLWKALLDMRDFGVRAINWTGGGEPTLHKDFQKLIVRANDLGLKQGLFTNALECKHRVEAAHLLDWIRISLTDRYIDGLDKDLARHYARETTTGICMNLTPQTASMADEMCRGARDLGVAYFQVRPALQRNYRQQPEIDVPSQLKNYETEEFKVYLSPYKFRDHVEAKSYSQCMAGPFVPVIDYWGNVRRCNYHLNDESEIVGNLADHRFGELMEMMPRAVPVREDCQTCCKNHELNRLLNDVLEIGDPDFI